MSPLAGTCLLPILLIMAAPAIGQHHHHSGSFASNSGHGYVVMTGYPSRGGPGDGGHGRGGYGLGAVSSGYGYGYPYLSYGYYPPPLVLVMPVQVQPIPVGPVGGLRLPMPPQDFNDPNLNLPRVRRANLARAKEALEVGDRSFRAGNTKRAEDKFNISMKADPAAPTPHIHLAQVSFVRGDYSAAADHLRNAVTVSTEAGWLINMPDIQTIYAEPGDFAKHLARLESHLQANPNDRDAWFVLGAECYLSGRTKQASDVFQRLTDRKADEALSAFLDASNTKLPAAEN